MLHPCVKKDTERQIEFLFEIGYGYHALIQNCDAVSVRTHSKIKTPPTAQITINRMHGYAGKFLASFSVNRNPAGHHLA